LLQEACVVDGFSDEDTRFVALCILTWTVRSARRLHLRKGDLVTVIDMQRQRRKVQGERTCPSNLEAKDNCLPGTLFALIVELSTVE
jgi:hypothetical protein